MKNNDLKVVVVAITSGDRWKFFNKVSEALLKDSHVLKFIIVDNASKNIEELNNLKNNNSDRVILLTQKENMGSAGGFKIGIEEARKIDCDYVYLTDDDSIPEDNFIEIFKQTLSYFDDKKIILCGNKRNIPDNDKFFFEPIVDPEKIFTFFNVFSFDKMKNFILLFLRKNNKRNTGYFIPVVPTKSFVYGGALIPIDAIREAPLPDEKIFLYGDDIEYSWNIIRLGYKSYLCYRPFMEDIDVSFVGSHIYAIFDPKTTKMRVYYRIRSMVFVSRKNTKQSKIILFLNIFLWIFGLTILCALKFGINKNFLIRLKLIIRAIRDGYKNNPDIIRDENLL